MNDHIIPELVDGSEDPKEDIKAWVEWALTKRDEYCPFYYRKWIDVDEGEEKEPTMSVRSFYYQFLKVLMSWHIGYLLPPPHFTYVRIPP